MKDPDPLFFFFNKSGFIQLPVNSNLIFRITRLHTRIKDGGHFFNDTKKVSPDQKCFDIHVI